MNLWPFASALPIFLLPAVLLATEPAAEDSIQPRSPGSFWQYTSYYFDGGQVFSAGTSSEKVVEFREIDGVRVYRIELTTDWRSLSERLIGVSLSEDDRSYYWEYFDEKGSHNFTEDWDEPAPPASLEEFALMLPYPVQDSFGYEADEITWKVVAVDREIEVPAGTFKTTVYEMTDDGYDDPEMDSRERYFMAPGVGLVRWEMDVKNESGEWVLDMRDDLFSYSLK